MTVNEHTNVLNLNKIILSTRAMSHNTRVPLCKYRMLKLQKLYSGPSVRGPWWTGVSRNASLVKSTPSTFTYHLPSTMWKLCPSGLNQQVSGHIIKPLLVKDIGFITQSTFCISATLKLCSNKEMAWGWTPSSVIIEMNTRKNILRASELNVY